MTVFEFVLYGLKQNPQDYVAHFAMYIILC